MRQRSSSATKPTDMARRYTQEMHGWLREHIPLQSCAAVAENFERTFGVPMTAGMVQSYAKNHKIHTKWYSERLTQEQAAWLIEHGPGTNNEDLTVQFNTAFGTRLTVAQINARRYRVGAVSGLTPRPPNSGQFRKGCVPFIKGKKWADYMSPEAQERSRATQFKPGNVPKRHRPVGSERVNVDGYIEVKVAEPKTWRLKHRVVWEQEHGPIPNGHAVTFLDGNRLNCAANNLALVDLPTNVRLNQMHLRYEDPQATQAGIAIAKIATAIGKRKKKKP